VPGEQGVCGDPLDACAVGCAVTAAERAAIQVLIAHRPTLDVAAIAVVLQAAPLVDSAAAPSPTSS
jgi:hypothetical protein